MNHFTPEIEAECKRIAPLFATAADIQACAAVFANAARNNDDASDTAYWQQVAAIFYAAARNAQSIE